LKLANRHARCSALVQSCGSPPGCIVMSPVAFRGPTWRRGSPVAQGMSPVRNLLAGGFPPTRSAFRFRLPDLFTMKTRNPVNPPSRRLRPAAIHLVDQTAQMFFLTSGFPVFSIVAVIHQGRCIKAKIEICGEHRQAERSSGVEQSLRCHPLRVRRKHGLTKRGKIVWQQLNHAIV